MTKFTLNENGDLNELVFTSIENDNLIIHSNSSDTLRWEKTDLRINGNADHCLQLNGEVHSIYASQYLYEPKEDITAYELALIFRLGGIFYSDAIESLPEGAKRHFRKVD